MFKASRLQRGSIDPPTIRRTRMQVKIGTLIAATLMITAVASLPAFAQPTADGKAATGPAGSGAGSGQAVRPTGEAGGSATTHNMEPGTAKGTKVQTNGKTVPAPSSDGTGTQK